MSFWSVYLELVKLGMQEKDAKRKFAFEMAERQGQITEKVVASLLKLVNAATGNVVDVVYDEELAPKGRSSMVEDSLAQLFPIARRELLKSLKENEELTAHGVLELFFADVEAKKASRMPGSRSEPHAPGAMRQAPPAKP